MVAVVGTLQNGYIKFDREVLSTEPVRVIVTFLEKGERETVERLQLSDFSFSLSQNNLANFEGSLSDTLIEERRTEL